MKGSTIKIWLLAIIFLASMVIPLAVYGNYFDPLFYVPDVEGFDDSQTLSQLVVRLLEILLAISGLIAVLFIILGGLRYIKSTGREEEIEKAKKTIIGALIGITVVLLSFALVRIVASLVLRGAAGL